MSQYRDTKYGPIDLGLDGAGQPPDDRTARKQVESFESGFEAGLRHSSAARVGWPATHRESARLYREAQEALRQEHLRAAWAYGALPAPMIMDRVNPNPPAGLGRELERLVDVPHDLEYGHSKTSISPSKPPKEDTMTDGTRPSLEGAIQDLERAESRAQVISGWAYSLREQLIGSGDEPEKADALAVPLASTLAGRMYSTGEALHNSLDQIEWNLQAIRDDLNQKPVEKSPHSWQGGVGPSS